MNLGNLLKRDANKPGTAEEEDAATQSAPSGLTVGRVAEVLEQWAPPQLAESYDNVGLLLGDATAAVTGVLVCLDVTPAVVEEAVQRGCNLIVAHHPIWFTARKSLRPDDAVGRTLWAASQQGVALYAIHTNLDAIQDGVNGELADRLGFRVEGFIEPRPATNPARPPAGSGLWGRLAEAMPLQAFLDHVQTTLGAQVLRYAPTSFGAIRKVGVCGGSGSFLIPKALELGLQALITADITYHKPFDAEGRLLLVDPGHYESERYTPERILNHLRKTWPEGPFHRARTNTNPFGYTYRPAEA